MFMRALVGCTLRWELFNRGSCPLADESVCGLILAYLDFVTCDWEQLAMFRSLHKKLSERQNIDMLD